MNKICGLCKKQFEITDFHKKIYARFMVPEARFCPDCRTQRRLSFRNERNLYHRKCDLSGANIISIYSENCRAPVYSAESWWSDKWDPLEYGRKIDFNRPFFEQFYELTAKVPLLPNVVLNSINCEYNSYIVESKNCYQSVRTGSSEDVQYSYLVISSERCLDCYMISNCQDCYECIDSFRLNSCQFCQLCQGSSNCHFCYDMIGCHDCFGCVGLRNTRHHFFNQKCTPEEYQKKVSDFLRTIGDPRTYRQKFYEEVVAKKPIKNLQITNSENSIGNNIFESRNIFHGFDIEKTDTSSYSWGVEISKDIHDCNFIYQGENCYENISNSSSQNIMFTFGAWSSCYNLLYCMLCSNNSHDCFGCISLKHNEYCILNKQYSKDEYIKLRDRLIEHMKKTGEWGQFFPPMFSFFAYNESVAQEYFPLEEEAALVGGWQWLAGEKTAKNFKMNPQELKFYRKYNIPAPKIHPDERHKLRVQLRNPKRLFTRKCAKCDNDMYSVYAADRPEIVYCEKCYLETVY
ncbi:hypothetical protein HYW82_04395 [Candidatus Peregrinibacteria bacterium]|nr:hypothetical protein [Candidatus Peregrinibacteria bacterium]